MLIVILIASYLNIVGGRIQSEKASLPCSIYPAATLHLAQLRWLDQSSTGDIRCCRKMWVKLRLFLPFRSALAASIKVCCIRYMEDLSSGRYLYMLYQTDDDSITKPKQTTRHDSIICRSTILLHNMTY